MITIVCKSLAPLCKDYEFVVNDKNQLAELIAKLVMGWSRHVGRLIKSLDPNYPDVDRATIQSQLRVLNRECRLIPKINIDRRGTGSLAWMCIYQTESDCHLSRSGRRA